MKEYVEVFPPGRKVSLDTGDGMVKAVVSKIEIAAGPNILYLCVYWVGKERKEVWTESREVEGRYEDGQRIGFRGE